MKKLTIVLCLMLIAGVAMARPVLYSPVTTGHKWVPSSRDVCWSEPADLADAKITSEIIAAFGLESEIANDFVVGANTTITKAIGYGGYYNWVQGDPELTSVNWKFYNDGGCYPNALQETFTGLGTVTFIGYDGYGYPTYKHEVSVSFDVTANDIYWLGMQAADHPFPPQWGRQGTGSIVTNCDSLIKSVFFGYPDWTPCGDLIGAPYDAAQEFECGQATATKATNWGTIKRLYR
jgi:hypothetical protein